MYALSEFIQNNSSLLTDSCQSFDGLSFDLNLIVDILGDNHLTGSEANDVLIGLGGDDTILGLSGKDIIFGGFGKDILAGGNDDDIIFGGFGEDIAKYSQQQQDFIFKGNPDRFQVIGAEGRDTLRGIEQLEFEDGLVETDTLNFLPAPLFDRVKTIETTIPSTGDPIDIYLPAASPHKANSLPVALLLQGANVDKSNYSTFASVVASYGFAVVVPNNLRTLAAPPPIPSVTGFFPELPQINEVFDYVRDPEVSPITKAIDPSKLALLGHSFGGAVGLSAVRGSCPFPNCPFGEFDRPDELVGAAFFGTDFQPSPEEGGSDSVPLIDNSDIPTALILGNNDGISAPAETEATFEQIQDPPKALIKVAGTNHFGITNENDPLNPPTTPAEVPLILDEPNPQTIPQEVAIDTIATWSSLFLRATILDDRSAFDFVFGGTGDELDDNVVVTSELPPDLL